MLHSRTSRLMVSVLLTLVSSPSISACATSSSDGAGYQFTRFANASTAIAVSQDALAGPAVKSNNEQCKKDKACKK